MKKLIIILSLISMLVLAGCSDANDYYSKEDFCKIQGYDGAEYIKWDSLLFKCFNISYSNETYDKGHLVIEKKTMIK